MRITCAKITVIKSHSFQWAEEGTCLQTIAIVGHFILEARRASFHCHPLSAPDVRTREPWRISRLCNRSVKAGALEDLGHRRIVGEAVIVTSLVGFITVY